VTGIPPGSQRQAPGRAATPPGLGSDSACPFPHGAAAARRSTDYPARHLRHRRLRGRPDQPTLFLLAPDARPPGDRLLSRTTGREEG